MTISLHNGDCVHVLASFPDNSVDSVVTDPPYGLAFMGKSWDCNVPTLAIWKQVFRVLKPGGHLLSFAGARTYHRMAVNIEDAGFEIRDQIMWVYGSGFPKSHNISKAIDKAAGAEREVIGRNPNSRENGTKANSLYESGTVGKTDYITVPATEAARQWNGWGTALKPAHEPICVARKPLMGTVAENVLQFGTGGLNIEGCRVGDTVETWPKSRSYAPGQIQPGHSGATQFTGITGNAPAGRWPANFIHDGSEEVLAGFPNTAPAKAAMRGTMSSGCLGGQCDTGPMRKEGTNTVRGHNDNGGSAARFFYCAKAGKSDRGAGNNHPTVKPTDLMRYLCRLVTPPKGTVLDPFMGSGSTGKACVLEGFGFIGIEKQKDYFEISQARINNIQRDPQMTLGVA